VRYEKSDIGVHETKNEKVVMKKFFILLLSSMPYITMAQGMMEVHDSQSFIQSALQFSKQWAEMIQQGADQAEQLQLAMDAETRRIKAVKEEIEEIVEITKDVLVLYKEIDNCNTHLENLRKNLMKSNYMSLDEKYTIYSRAQNLCYDIFKRRSDIDKMVQDCKKYSENKKAEKKKEKIKEITDVVRKVQDCLVQMERMSMDIIAYKKQAIEQDYMLRKCFSLKLY
jgi:dsDNA-specific endonuclease/ATPase MutS2